MSGSWSVPVRIVRPARLLILLALLAGTALVVGACGKKDETGPAGAQGRPAAQMQGKKPGGAPGRRPGGGEQAVPVAVSTARTGSIASYYHSTATLEAERQAQVLARVAGVAAKLKAEEGDQVPADGPLLVIENDEYRYRLQQAEASTANLRARYQRLEAMLAEELTTEEEFQAARSELETAEANEGLARLELSYTTVHAPFEGQITQRLIDEGQNISTGDPLFVLADFHPLLARVHVPSREFRKLQLNQKVDLTLDSDGTALEGTIRLISPVIDATSGTIKITIEVNEFPAGTRPGDFAEVRIVTERRDDVVLVPRAAVITDKGDRIVYVALPGEGDAVSAERRIVSVGFTDDESAQITDGLEPGEQIVVKGQRSLKHGAPLKILETIDAGA